MTKHTPQQLEMELPAVKLCECGCGQPAPIAQRNSPRLGHVRGQPVRFIAGHHNKIRPQRPAEERFWEKVDKRGPDECWEWTGSSDQHGYGQLRINGRGVKAHRFSYALHNGPIPEGMDILHRCDHPPCVNPVHLFAGTAKDNSQDMIAKGRGSKPPVQHMKGEKHPRAYFTNEQIETMRQEFAEMTISVAKFAALYGISQPAMWNILNRKSYQDA